MSDPMSATSFRRWVSLAACCAAAGLVWLTFVDLGVAIPTIADEFDADLSTLQWADNAFSLVTGALVIALRAGAVATGVVWLLWPRRSAGAD
jgi:hypothetical protein